MEVTQWIEELGDGDKGEVKVETVEKPEEEGMAIQHAIQTGGNNHHRAYIVNKHL